MSSNVATPTLSPENKSEAVDENKDTDKEEVADDEPKRSRRSKFSVDSDSDSDSSSDSDFEDKEGEEWKNASSASISLKGTGSGLTQMNAISMLSSLAGIEDDGDDFDVLQLNPYDGDEIDEWIK
jgi:hypothetical protein